MNTKVIHVINGEFYAGAERVQDLLAINLPDHGYEVGFVCLKEGIFPGKRKAINAPLYLLKMNSRVDIKVGLEIAKIAKKEKCRLIHTHTPRTALIGQIASIASGIPMIHHIHGPTTQDTEQYWRNRRNALVEKLSVLKSACFIPVSAAAMDYALSIGLSKNKMRMVWNGVPTPLQDPVIKERDEFVIGSIALFRPRKGIEVLIEAFAKLCERNDGKIILNMVGDFETREYESLIKNLAINLKIDGRINWLGFAADVYAHLRNMDVFVLPSLYGEGMPMVVLEAMACGIPIVATQVGGIQEAIRQGEDGLLVHPGNYYSLYEALEMMLSNISMRRTVSQNARKRQIECFSDRSMAAGVAKVYDEILHH